MEVKEKHTQGKHPNSLANLKPMRKGDPSRNPKGRPKRGLCISEALRAILESKDPKDGKLIADKVAEVIVSGALKGDARMIEVLLDRTEGKVAQPISGAISAEVNVDYRGKLLDAISRHSARGGEEEGTQPTQS